MDRPTSTQIETSPGKSFNDWMNHMELDLLEQQAAESRRRQRQALRAWKWDLWIHRLLLMAFWIFVTTIGVLAFLGFCQVCQIFSRHG